MIDIPINIDYHGTGTNIVKVGRVRIANTGDYMPSGYAYVYLIESYASPFDEDGVFTHGVIRNYSRDQPITSLLQAVMADNGKGKCQLSEEYATLWKEKGQWAT